MIQCFVNQNTHVYIKQWTLESTHAKVVHEKRKLHSQYKYNDDLYNDHKTTTKTTTMMTLFSD